MWVSLLRRWNVSFTFPCCFHAQCVQILFKFWNLMQMQCNMRDVLLCRRKSGRYNESWASRMFPPLIAFNWNHELIQNNEWWSMRSEAKRTAGSLRQSIFRRIAAFWSFAVGFKLRSAWNPPKNTNFEDFRKTVAIHSTPYNLLLHGDIVG